jgi:hypothetical protein
MKKLIILATLSLSITPACADGLFMGKNWNSGSVSRSVSEDTEGVAAGRFMKPSVQVYGPRYAGKGVSDGVCDEFQPQSTDSTGIIAWKLQQPTHYLYAHSRTDCFKTYYPGWTWGSQNMALAPHWDGTPDWAPVTFNYMDWTDPRYNPAMRNGG